MDKFFEESSSYRKRSNQRADKNEYYTLREIMDKYHIGRKAVWGRCDRLGIPKIYIARNTFFSKTAVDSLYNKKMKYADIIDWITPEEMRTTFKMTAVACRNFIKRHKIPAKVEYGKTYYSKQHIIDVKERNFEGRERYYDIEEASEKHKISKDVVRYYVRHYKITRIRFGQFVFFKKDELDRVIKERQMIRLEKTI